MRKGSTDKNDMTSGKLVPDGIKLTFFTGLAGAAGAGAAAGFGAGTAAGAAAGAAAFFSSCSTLELSFVTMFFRSLVTCLSSEFSSSSFCSLE